MTPRPDITKYHSCVGWLWGKTAPPAATSNSLINSTKPPSVSSFISRGWTRYQTGTVPLCSTSGSRSTIDLTSIGIALLGEFRAPGSRLRPVASVRRSCRGSPAGPSAGVDRPGTLALPLVGGPGHLVLVVLGGASRVDPDEIAAAGVVGGEVPRALQELVRAVGGTAGVVRLVVVAALVA